MAPSTALDLRKVHNHSLERTRTSRFGYGEFLRQWRLVRATQPGR
jgi:hypothetical protein